MKVEAQLVHLRVIKNPERRKKLFAEIRSTVDLHLMLEELFVYPFCEKFPRLASVVDQGRRAHELIRGVMDDLEVIEPESRRYNSLLTQLVINLEKHVISEEEKLFPAIKKYIDTSEFKRMNREILTKYESEQGRAGGRRAA